MLKIRYFVCLCIFKTGMRRKIINQWYQQRKVANKKKSCGEATCSLSLNSI